MKGIKIGWQVTAVLVKGWILPTGGVASERVCVCSFFFLAQSGGATRWRVCYQRGLPRLVLQAMSQNWTLIEPRTDPGNLPLSQSLPAWRWCLISSSCAPLVTSKTPTFTEKLVKSFLGNCVVCAERGQADRARETWNVSSVLGSRPQLGVSSRAHFRILENLTFSITNI